MSGAAGSSRDGKKPAEPPATPPPKLKPEGEDPSPSPSDKGDNGPPPPPTSDDGNRPRRRPPAVNNTYEKRTIPNMEKKLDGPNFTAWAKSLKMLMFLYPVPCLYKYNI